MAETSLPASLLLERSRLRDRVQQDLVELIVTRRLLSDGYLDRNQLAALVGRRSELGHSPAHCRSGPTRWRGVFNWPGTTFARELGDELVTSPADGQEVARVRRVRLESTAQAHDEVVHRAGRGGARPAPSAF